MPRHTRTYLPAVAAAIATAVAIAACGGTASPPSTTGHTTASAGAPQPGQPGATAYRFADCMRSHGVSNFPDPKVHQHGQDVTVMIRLNPSVTSSPAFKSASQACRKILPGPGPQASSPAETQRQRQDALAFSQCMRNHGFSNFPDPTAQGELNPQMVTAAGINLHQPAVLHAGLACVPVTHGLITAADVQRAVNGNENGG